MTRPLLSLVMIVKDEAANIRATLESVKPFVDHWTIVDTGSTDDTVKIIQEVMFGVPGQLSVRPFVDFATTRNFALVLASETMRGPSGEVQESPVFTLMLSADEVFAGGEALRSFLESKIDSIGGARGTGGAYCVEMRQGHRAWQFTRVLCTDANWRYEGVIHERPVGPAGETNGPLIPGVTVTHGATDPERKIKRMREYDLPKLDAIVADEERTLEDRAHAIFFLAETEANLAAQEARVAGGTPKPGSAWWTRQMRAMSLYWRYAQIADQPAREGYDADKVHYALFMFYHLSESTGFHTPEELMVRLEALAAAAPMMPEVHFLLAKHAAFVDARRGVALAENAAKVARASRSRATTVVAHDNVEWQALRLAAACSKAIGKSTNARNFASQALAAGAPREVVEEYLR